MPKPILLLNGPNMNLLGEREPDIYGRETLADIENRCRRRAEALGYAVQCLQSNWEGALVDRIHAARHDSAAIIINPAGLSFSSIPLMDALKMFAGPRLEVHMSNIHRRDPIYHYSLVSKAVDGVIAGLGPFGYELAVDAVHNLLLPSAPPVTS